MLNMIQDNLKPYLHCAKTAAMANGVLCQSSRAVLYRDSSTFMRLYLVYVRPLLDYCIQALDPQLEGNKLCLEKVQKIAVNMVSNIVKVTFSEKLTKLRMTTLEEKRWRGDIIQTWRILSGKDRVNV